MLISIVWQEIAFWRDDKNLLIFKTKVGLHTRARWQKLFFKFFSGFPPQLCQLPELESRVSFQPNLTLSWYGTSSRFWVNYNIVKSSLFGYFKFFHMEAKFLLNVHQLPKLEQLYTNKLVLIDKSWCTSSRFEVKCINIRDTLHLKSGASAPWLVFQNRFVCI